MYSFNELDTAQIDITHRCQASCPMCLRNICGGVENPNLKTNDWTVDDFKKIFNDEVLAQLRVINFCGNFGEPILNNNLIEMCQYVKDSSSKVQLNINTNGSARTTEWWRNLAAALPDNHKVEFALDGLKDTHHLHRVGTNFDKIIENAKAFIQAGGKAHWMYIMFAHNEHQVNEAQALANEVGFKTFKVKHSKRHSDNYKVLDRQGNVSHYIDRPKVSQVNFVRKEDLADFLDWPNGTEINCIASKDKSIYIDAFFTVVPCCYTGGLLYASFDKELHDKYGINHESLILDAGDLARKKMLELVEEMGGKYQLNAVTQGLKNIVNSEKWQTIWKQKWDTKGSPICMYICSADSPFTAVAKQRQLSVEFKNV